MKRITAMLLAMLMVLLLAACGAGAGTGAQEADTAPEKEETTTAAETAAPETAEPEPEPETPGEGDLGDFHVKFLDCTFGKDYEGKDVIIANYEFTNNSEKTTSAIVALRIQAFQDGVELENGIMMDDVGSGNSMKDLRPGATLDIHEVFVLGNQSSPVEFEASETFSFSDDMVTLVYNFS